MKAKIFRLKLIWGFILIIVCNTASLGQEKQLQDKIESPRYIRVMFYNCENLFDYIDDTLINDEEFLPDGDRYWNKDKYYDKLKRVSKVITAVGGWSPPEIIGLCEIENLKTLTDLTRNTPLYRAEYKIIHQESPDNRGIDVALLFQPKNYTPISTHFIRITFPGQPDKHTRDILYSKGALNQSDTVHIFVNHWPSRWGGQLESEEYRIYVASVLKMQTDSIFNTDSHANIVIMGDFNDEPNCTSIINTLKATSPGDSLINNKLYNLSHSGPNSGTHKYQGSWAILDQIMVSGNLLNNTNGIKTSMNNYVIFNLPFLLETDDAYLGYKPFRTFTGFKFNGGYSDHLPVFMDIDK